MKKKLAVVRAMLHRPALLFLDEPSAGLDPVAAAGLREELASVVRREGVTVFLTTHNLSEAERLCSKVAVIRNGKLLAQGRPDELRGNRPGPAAQRMSPSTALMLMLGGGAQVPLASHWAADLGYRYSRIAADSTLSATALNTNLMTFGFGYRF